MSTTALITGGTSGIGRAVANKLARLGIHTLVVGRNEERGEKTIAEIRAAGGKANFISSDLRDASSARQVMMASATAPPTIVGTNSKKSPPRARPSKYSRAVTPMVGRDTLVMSGPR